MLPNEMIIGVGRFLNHIDRMRLYSSFHPDLSTRSASCDAMMIGDILEYYDTHFYRDDDDQTIRFFCEYIEWVVFHNGTGSVMISDITSRKHRNVERHFTEIWKLYGGTLSFGSHSIIIPPPFRLCTSIVHSFISKWFDDDVERLGYGYNDY